MLLNTLLILLGSGLIIGGANFLTDGASALAKRLNVSDLVVGLTVVAFGTSAPELSVSIVSALQGSGAIAVGNVLGSNIVNVLAILGITALVFPLKVGKSVQRFDLPVAILAAGMLFLVLADGTIDGGAESLVTRSEGLILLSTAILYLSYILYKSKKGLPSSVVETELSNKKLGLPLALLYIVGGLLALVGGGKAFVQGASQIARTLGVSETLIGLTLVAWGTSLPELATSLVAAFKKKTDMAIGNVIGSNIFNIFIVLGTTAVIHPLKGLEFTLLDLVMQFVAIALVYLFARFLTRGRITRWQGALLVLILIAYNYLLISKAL